jgi:hypothetical protein
MTFRSRKLLDAPRGLRCVRCGRLHESVVGAHYTGVRRGSYGGGMSIKVHDFCVADLCGECHEWMDRLSRDKSKKWEHSEEFLHCVMLTIARRFERGVIVVSRNRTEAEKSLSTTE